MFDYFHYFADKSGLPEANDILALEEKYVIKGISQEEAEKIQQAMFEYAKKYEKPVGVRIIFDGQVLVEQLGEGLGEPSLDWLRRKEKVVNETHHSSYYVFLDNINSHINDHMILDESYGICGGSFPLIVDGEVRGTITCTGLRPEEDHDVVMYGLKELCHD